MIRKRIGELDVVMAGGSDREGGGDGPCVVLLHGFGAPGEDLAPLWRVLDVPAGTRFVFPAAPLELPSLFGQGRAWWMIDIEAIERALRDGAAATVRSREEPDGLAEARAKLDGLLDALDAPKLFLGGFSQGAMLACDAALRSSRRIDGLALLSGTLIAEDAWRAAAPSRRGLPVLQSHGEDDPLLPFAAAERLRDLLAGAGLEVEFVPFRGGHAIPDRVLDRLGAFISRLGAL
jgi:phospholipase/carboxylesterase